MIKRLLTFILLLAIATPVFSQSFVWSKPRKRPVVITGGYVEPGYNNMIFKLSFDTDANPSPDTGPEGTNVMWFGIGAGMPTYYPKTNSISGCYYFDGVNDTGFVNHVQQMLQLSTGEVFSASCWRNIRVAASFGDTVWYKGKTAANYEGIRLKRYGTNECAQLSAVNTSTNAWYSQTLGTPSASDDYVWKHLFYCYNGSVTSQWIYVDGLKYDMSVVLYSNLYLDVTNTWPFTLSMMVKGDNRYNLDGWIDEVIVYTNWLPTDDDAVSSFTNQMGSHGWQSADIYDMPWWSNTVSYSPCEEGNRVGDYSRISRGAPAVSPSTVYGTADNGTNYYAYVCNNSEQLYAGSDGANDYPFIMDGWYMCTNAVAPVVFRRWGTRSGYQGEGFTWNLYYGTNYVILVDGTSYAKQLHFIQKDATYTPNDWVYTCWAYDGNLGMRLWTNGVECELTTNNVGGYSYMPSDRKPLAHPYYSLADGLEYCDMVRFATGIVSEVRILDRWNRTRIHFGK